MMKTNTRAAMTATPTTAHAMAMMVVVGMPLDAHDPVVMAATNTLTVSLLCCNVPVWQASPIVTAAKPLPLIAVAERNTTDATPLRTPAGMTTVPPLMTVELSTFSSLAGAEMTSEALLINVTASTVSPPAPRRNENEGVKPAVSVKST